MSPNIKTPDLNQMIQQLADARQALIDERKSLADRIVAIDQALGVTPVVTPSKSKAAPKAPKGTGGGIPDAIFKVLARRPGLTIRELIEAIPEHQANSVEATTRGMAGDGRLAKDDQTPRHYSLPSKTKVA